MILILHKELAVKILDFYSKRMEAILTMLIALFLCVGLFGYAFFTLSPENLARFPKVAGVHATAMVALSQVQSMLFVVLMFLTTLRTLNLKLALLTSIPASILGFAAEYLGTTTGLPFGHYSYTDMMGVKLLGQVPWVIPLSWFSMGLPCYIIVRRLIDGKHPLIVALCGGWLLMTWDLVLDPAMSHLLPYWEWHQPGFYYNSPLINFFGWFVVGSCIVYLFEKVIGAKQAAQFSIRWTTGFFFLNFVMPAGMCLLAGIWEALLVTFASLLICFFACGLLPHLSNAYIRGKTRARGLSGVAGENIKETGTLITSHKTNHSAPKES